MNSGFDELKTAGITLRGVTRGGVHTCLMVPELDLMFDVGTLPKGAMRHTRILVSHGHHDHLGALPYLASQRSLMRAQRPRAHVPQEILAPLRTIFAAWSEIEDFELPIDLIPHLPEDVVDLGKGLSATCIRSVHRVPSLAWFVQRTSHRLKAEYRGLPGLEIKRLRDEAVEVTEPHSIPQICVTGDTRIELFLDDARLRQCAVLVHEVTSWDDRRDVEQIRAWGHTHVEEMIEHAEKFEGEALVLVHRSLRHSKSEAERIVRQRFPAGVRDRVHVFGT